MVSFAGIRLIKVQSERATKLSDFIMSMIGVAEMGVDLSYDVGGFFSRPGLLLAYNPPQIGALD